MALKRAQFSTRPRGFQLLKPWLRQRLKSFCLAYPIISFIGEKIILSLWMTKTLRGSLTTAILDETEPALKTAELVWAFWLVSNWTVKFDWRGHKIAVFLTEEKVTPKQKFLFGQTGNWLLLISMKQWARKTPRILMPECALVDLLEFWRSPCLKNYNNLNTRGMSREIWRSKVIRNLHRKVFSTNHRKR